MVLGAAPCRADAQTDEPRVGVQLENGDGKSVFTVDGQAAHLPDGTLLHISLQVRDRHPTIEIALFRVTVMNGRYSGRQEWQKKTFAPLAYRTVVDLHMEMQSPATKRFLSKQLGYTSDQVETISVAETVLGSDEERAAFALATLRTLSDFHDRVSKLHGQLSQMVQAPQDPAWATFQEPFIADMKRALEELKDLQDTRVAWFDIGMFTGLNQAIRQVSRALGLHLKKRPLSQVLAELNNTAGDLRVMRDEMNTRLPAEPHDDGAAPPPAPGGK